MAKGKLEKLLDAQIEAKTKRYAELDEEATKHRNVANSVLSHLEDLKALRDKAKAVPAVPRGPRKPRAKTSGEVKSAITENIIE